MKMTRSDYNDRNYDFSQIEDDPRLKRSAEEMQMTFWAYAAYVLITLCASYYTAAHFAFNEVFWFGIPAYLMVLMICAVVGGAIMMGLMHFVFREDKLTDDVEQ